MLVLKQANKSRPGGQWDADDYDVIEGERCIGRIILTSGIHGHAVVLVDHGTSAAAPT